MKLQLTTISFLFATALGQGRTSPPDGAIVVSPSGGDFSTVQEAVDSLGPDGGTIYIAAGDYQEQVFVPDDMENVTLLGETEDVSSYTSNTVTISQGRSQDDSENNDATGTLRNHAANSNVYNINFVNTRGEGSQALALSAQATNQGYYGCQFLGFQDTVYANEGNQVYASSLIQGATDFIFGQRATAWFDNVDIKLLTAGTGYITANGRDSADNPSYYVINRSTVDAAEGNSIESGAYYLGRPWRSYARVVFQETSLSDAISPQGWSKWNGDDDTSNIFYAEYQNTGEGAEGDRVDFSRQLDAAVPIEDILGSDYADWVDTGYLS